MQRSTRLLPRPRARARMIARASLLGVGLVALALGQSACDDQEPARARLAPAPKAGAGGDAEVVKKASRPAPSADQVQLLAKRFFAPLPARAESATNPITEAKVALGRTLYYDPRLSKNHDVSCNTCHLLDKYGVDGTPVSVGHKKQNGDRNAPTVYNAALHFTQFWDGREPDVEAQAKGPLINPVEMAMADHNAVMKTIKSIPGYAEMFKAAFPEAKDPMTIDNFGLAVGAFERGLITPAPFDKFLQGDSKALSKDALRGLQLFVDAQCVTCHVGATLGGTQFQKIGNLKDYPTEDEGRFKVTNNEADKKVFKVPSLRNIAKTAPYFHDGSKATLTDAINTMAEYQTVKGSFTDEERADLIAFLDTLTGEIDQEYIKQPPLPESGPNTPKPDPT